MPYRVTYAIDYMDSNPVVKVFVDEWEALDYLSDAIDSRVGHIVQHAPYTISEDDYDSIVENEHALAKIERV